MTRLNLGCGDRYAEGGWVNVDHAGSPHRADAIVDLRGPLPWGLGSLTEVYAGHLLEHLTVEDSRALLGRLLPCMAPGGELMVVGPDLIRAQAMAEAGSLDVTLDSLRYGADRWDGDQHLWECAPLPVMGMLYAAGWVKVIEVGIGDVPAKWPVADRRPVWQFAVTARAPVGG